MGRVLPNFRCKLIENNQEKNEGECYVRNKPQVSKGYYKDPISNDKYFKNFKSEDHIKYYNIGDFLKS